MRAMRALLLTLFLFSANATAILSGTCGVHLSAEQCSELAYENQAGFTVVSSFNEWNRPHGCFYFDVGSPGDDQPSIEYEYVTYTTQVRCEDFEPFQATCVCAPTGPSPAPTSVTWTSAVPASTVESAATGGLTFTFGITTALVGSSSDTMTLTASSAIFTTDNADTPCTVSLDTGGGVVDISSSTTCATVGNALTITTTADMAPGAVIVVVSDNLADNAAAGTVVTFGAESTTDTAALTGETGYTTTAAPAPTWELFDFTTKNAMNNGTCFSLLSKTDCENLKNNPITIGGITYQVIEFKINPIDPFDYDELAIPHGCSVVIDPAYTGNAHAFFNDRTHKTTTCGDIFSSNPNNEINCLCKKPPTTTLVTTTTQTGRCATQLTREECLQAHNADSLSLNQPFEQRNGNDVPNGCMYQVYAGADGALQHQYWYSNLDGTRSDGLNFNVGDCKTSDEDIPTTCVCASPGSPGPAPTSVTWTSAVPASTVEYAATGGLTFTFGITTALVGSSSDTMTLTASSAIFTTDNADTPCTVSLDTGGGV
jgi:uncharacterized RmlC-like cupin family protein